MKSAGRSTVVPALRRAYEGVALFAVLNLLVMTGLAAYVLGSGGLNAAKVRRIASVIRGDELVTFAPIETPAELSEEAVRPPKTADARVDTQVELEIVRREAERVKEEIRQRLALSNRIMLRIEADRENFRRERETVAQAEEARRAQMESEGFAKQIAILAGVKPRTAAEHLLDLRDPDEAARILLAMETRQAKKIVEAATRPDQVEQMKTILQRLRDVSPARSAELEPES